MIEGRQIPLNRSCYAYSRCLGPKDATMAKNFPNDTLWAKANEKWLETTIFVYSGQSPSDSMRDQYLIFLSEGPYPNMEGRPDINSVGDYHLPSCHVFEIPSCFMTRITINLFPYDDGPRFINQEKCDTVWYFNPKTNELFLGSRNVKELRMDERFAR